MADKIPDIRWRKIKFKDSRVCLKWEESSDALSDEWIEHKLSNPETPRPEFETALQALVSAVPAICELPKKYGESMRVIGVSMAYSKDGVRGATISVAKSLLSGPVYPINTPYLPEEPYTEDGGEQVLLPEGCVKAIDALIDEAHLYLQGERAQGDPFAGEPSDDKQAA